MYEAPRRPKRPIAHSPRTPGQEPHDLHRHLRDTGVRAGGFGEPWGAGVAAALAGRWHDLGKYRPRVQARIGGDADGHLETQAGRPIHSYAGASLALRALAGAPTLARLVAMAIAGHHAGLPDWETAEQEVGIQGDSHLREALVGGVTRDLIDAPALPDLPDDVDAGLWGRFLASALVDADFLDTEAYYDRGRKEQRGGWASLAELAPRFEAGLDEKLAQARAAPSPIDPLRDSVLAACRAAAAGPAGLYALSVPTGGGKTLAGLAFAFAHAATRPGVRRVIYAAPYTSILEQTADVFRTVLGDRDGDAVLEHHSALAEGDESSDRLRLAAENWDAPVVVTTNVQLFESLFAARVSKIRRLHNLAGSVLILDEVQALPPAVLAPISAVLRELPRFGVTVLLCTATQPALGAVFRGFTPIPVIADPAALFRALDRVTVEVRPPQGWAEIAADLAAEPRVLAIVNTRAECRRLHALMPAGTIHLSALQCAAHRREIIADIRRRLAAGAPVRVVATSVVEAGIDIDFPVVVRAMAGLDTLVQAAGRCNRHGGPCKGRFVVVSPLGDDGRPSSPLSQAAAITRPLIAETGASLFDPAIITRYFEDLFWARGERRHDEDDLIGLLRLPRADGLPQGGERHAILYRSAARSFRMIDDEWQATLVVACADSQRWIDTLRAEGPSRELLRALQPFTVSVPAGRLAALADDVHGLAVLRDPGRYHPETGLEVGG